MDKQNLSDKLEGYRNRNQKNHDYINKDLYRILYSRDINSKIFEENLTLITPHTTPSEETTGLKLRV